MAITMDFNERGSRAVIAARLDQGLSLDLSARVIPPHDQCLTHTVVEIGRGLGFPRNMDALATLELWFVTPEGRAQGYKSGVGDIYVHPSFGGLNIASILVHNALDLFRENGDRDVECNTQSLGAYFWQRMGWLATKHGTEFGETIFDENSCYIGWSALVGALKRKPYDGYLSILKKSGAQVEKALSLLNETEPSSIWALIDSGITVEVYDHRADENYEMDFARLVLNGEQVNTSLNLESNWQMDRFQSRVNHLAFDRPRFEQIWQAERGRHIRNINTEAMLYGFAPIDPALEL